MKKNFLFKWVSVLGAMLLLANVALPGMVAFAEDETPSETAPVTVVITTDNNSEFKTNWEIYDFTSYSSDESHTEYATGKAQVVAQWTVVEVEKNYKVEYANDNWSFVNKQFAIKVTEDSLDTDKPYQLYPVGENAMTLTNDVYVKIGEKSTESDSTYYDFTSYADEQTTTKWWDGKVKVINGFSTVKVIENYAKESTWVNKTFTIDATTRDNNKETLHKITPADNENNNSNLNLYVQIIAQWTNNEKTTYDYISYSCSSSTDNTTPSVDSCDKWWYWTVEVVASEESNDSNPTTESESTKVSTTKVKVIENYAKTDAFVNSEYTVNETLRDKVVKTYHKLLPAVSLWDNNTNTSTTSSNDELYVQIVEENEAEWENWKITYDYISYVKNGETYTKRWYWTVELEEQWTIVEVAENYRLDSSFVWQKFYIYALEADTSVYQLHPATTTDTTQIYVKVSKNWEKYDFVSYADTQATTKWWDGTVKVLNPFTVVKVVENSVEGFVNNYYVIYATEISSNSDYIPLYTTQGQAANISMKLSAFTVSFNSNGGSDVASQTVNPWEKATKPANPTRSNYTFKGWFSDKALTTEWDFSSNTVTKNTTLYAKWEQNKSSSSSSSSSGGGGSSGGSSSSSSKSTTKTDAKSTTGDNKTTTTNDNKADTKLTESNTNANNNWTTPAYNDNYSKEMNDAYQFAYKNGITTMPSIDEADMTGWLTRIAMAKMLSQYAINVLGKTPDTTKVVPNFSDVPTELNAEYNNWVTLAYQLGIMWIGIEKFRPFDLVTRAEFGTALSRMLYGLADWEWDSWYKTHLDKLMEEKIITVDTPDLQELRWYVMIMLMRSAQK